MEDITRDANKNILEDILPILDNFEWALASDQAGQGNPFLQGMEMVYQGLMTTLASHGLQPILAKGQPFDQCLHEAVAMEGDQGDHTLVVLEEVQTGYLFNEKVLRHTRVLVGPNKEEDECQK
jgi:molecular chaperone GrpE